MKSNKVLITTFPFGEVDDLPIKILKEEGLDYLINPLGKKPNEKELAEMLTDFDMVIAGTEKYTQMVLNSAKKLKFISRVGIGLDGIDFSLTNQRKIKVSYTPDAPTSSVAELTLGFILTLMRNLIISNKNMHNNNWKKLIGKSFSASKVGIIGLGPIGREVYRLLASFNCNEILLNDIYENKEIKLIGNTKWTDKESIFKNADILTIHAPLNEHTKNMIDKSVLLSMKKDAILINTSRGGIINENDLLNVLSSGHLGGVALDVFEAEPYRGGLTKIERCLLTPHIGTMTADCRTMMEVQAVKEVVRFSKGKKLKRMINI